MFADLLYVHWLLCEPDMANPVMLEIADIYKTSCDQYTQLARKCTKKYASI